MSYRIWIDQDSVLYNLHGPWLDAHNRDYPGHSMTIEDHTSWDVDEACRAAGCAANMHAYFDLSDLWTDGDPLPYSQLTVHNWLRDIYGVKLGVLTTAANSMCMRYKMDWLSAYFPEIRDVIMVNNHLKHLVRGDILLDDGLHNLEHWPGIGICFTQPWNKDADVLRANDWQEVDVLVRKAIELLDEGDTPAQVHEYLYLKQTGGL